MKWYELIVREKDCPDIHCRVVAGIDEVRLNEAITHCLGDGYAPNSSEVSLLGLAIVYRKVARIAGAHTRRSGKEFDCTDLKPLLQPPSLGTPAFAKGGIFLWQIT